jgi:hypothetical protein
MEDWIKNAAGVVRGQRIRGFNRDQAQP